MNAEIEFLRRAEANAVPLYEVIDQRQRGGPYRAVNWINSSRALAETLGLSDFPCAKITDFDLAETDPEGLMREAARLDGFLKQLRAKYLFELEPDLLKDSVPLDEKWQSRIGSYLERIRALVRDNVSDPSMLAAVMGKLNDFQLEVDRGRTRMQSVAAVFLQITKVIGKGAQNLEPAMRLVERLSSSLSGLPSDAEIAAQPPSLPSPETLGLTDQGVSD